MKDSSAISQAFNRRLESQPRCNSPAFLKHDVPVSLAPRVVFRALHQRLKHVSGHFPSARNLHFYTFYKIEPLKFPPFLLPEGEWSITQVWRASRWGPTWPSVYSTVHSSPHGLLTSLQNEPPPPPTAIPPMMVLSPKIECAPEKAGFMVWNSFCLLFWFFLPRGACSPIMCKDNQYALLFFYLPKQGNIFSSLWHSWTYF